MMAVAVTSIEGTLQITARLVAGIPILHVAGPFVAWADPDRTLLRSEVSRLISEARVSVLVHLSRMTDIDAQGLGELAWSSAMVRRLGGQMALIAPRRLVRQLLMLTKLDTILPIYDSEDQALASALMEVLHAEAGAGDGDRTRDIKLGKLAFYR
jgi:anti-sigma B factor antagonist